jgi:hypothetical protein
MESSHTTILDRQQTLDFAILRNDFLDAFSDLETEVTRILCSCGVAASNEAFGLRLQKFREVSKTSLIANANYVSRDRVADDIAKLLSLRADIIHSRMLVRLVANEPSARFVNSQDAHSKHPSGRELSLAEMQTLVSSIRNLADQIKDLRRKANPAF